MKDYGKHLKEITQNTSTDKLIKELIALVHELIDENKRLRLENQQLRLENQELKAEVRQLKDEIVSLKNQPPRPKITPSNLEKDTNEVTTRKTNWTKSSKSLIIDRTVKIDLSVDQIPQGAEFKGYKDYIVQELIIKKETTCYKIAQWKKPDGKYISAKLPEELNGYHFGTSLRKYIIYQHYNNRVPQNRIFDDLQDKGIAISEGQIETILKDFALSCKSEKDALLLAGMMLFLIMTDDTGGRHKKRNCFTLVICNEFFTFFKTTNSKSRINFLEALCGEKIEYTINKEALTYIKAYKPSDFILDQLTDLLDQKPKNKAEWDTFLEECKFGKSMRRILTEGALIGTLVASGFILPDKIFVMSDGAGQFKSIGKHIPCLVHIERSIKKIIPLNEKGRLERDAILDKFWALYHALKVYKKLPSIAQTKEQKLALEAKFDEIASFMASEVKLSQALKKFREQKEEVLRVLEYPYLPLHNNMSENDIREIVTIRKISGGTRSDEGRDARDTVTSLRKTCKKLKISFWQFVEDRLTKANLIRPLADIIREKIYAAASSP